MRTTRRLERWVATSGDHSPKGSLRARPTLVLVAPALLLTACGSGLSGTSTCQDYLGAAPDEQQRIVSQLAGEYRKPDYATPLGFPDVAYECATQPAMTLAHFFSAAQG